MTETQDTRFLEHLEELRKVLIKIISAVALAAHESNIANTSLLAVYMLGPTE